MFKRCPNCGFQWPARCDFLEDPLLKLVGYQVNYKTLTAGIVLFNHSCKGTLAIYAEEFRDLYDGPIFTRKAGSDAACPGRCLREDDLGPCPVQCECAYVREILQKIKQWPKHAEQPILAMG